VIEKTLELLMEQKPIGLGGFFTWNGGKDDPHVYMRPASQSRRGEVYRLASWNTNSRGLRSDISAFEVDGVRVLGDTAGAELIIMDELGFLEKDAPAFRQAVLDTLGCGIPVLGVLRRGDVPWHEDIKANPAVRIIDVDEKNRDTLPRELADTLRAVITGDERR